MVRAKFVGRDAEVTFRVSFQRIVIDDTVVVGVGERDVRVLAQVVKGGYQIGDTIYAQVEVEEAPQTEAALGAPRPKNKGGRPRNPAPPPPPEVVETKEPEAPNADGEEGSGDASDEVEVEGDVAE